MSRNTKPIKGMSCVMINAKSGGRVSTKDIYGAKHLIVEGTGSIIANSVMNGILYPEAELEKIASDKVGWIHAPNGHPSDPEGNFVPAGSPYGIMQGYIGAMSGNYRMEDRRLVRDIAVNIEVAEKTEAGRELLRRIKAGEDIDTSTGLLFMPIKESGVGEDGERYDRIATNMMLDHDAILLNEAGAATTDQGVGIFANAKDDTADVEFADTATNASIPATGLEVKDIPWDEAGAIERIKVFTKSTSKPGINYRRYFLKFDRDNVDSFDAYSMPFADVVDGKPVAVLSQIMKYSDELDDLGAEGMERAVSAISKYSATRNSASLANELGLSESLSKKLIKSIVSFLKGDYNRTVNNALDQPEENPMKDKIVAALSAAGVNMEGKSDDQLFEAYNELMAKKNTTETPPAAANAGDADSIAKVVNAALANALTTQLKPLQDKMTSIESTLNANRDSELSSLAAKVEALDIGLNAASAKALGVDALKSLIAKNSGTVNFNSALNARFDTAALGDLPE